MSGQTEHEEKVLSHIWRTYKSRYNAAHRCQQISTHETMALTAISMCALAFSLLTLVLPPSSPAVGTRVAVYTILLTVALIAFSISAGKAENRVRAMQFHTCAVRLQELYDAAMCKPEPKSRDIPESPSSMVTGYYLILKEYDVNHKLEDFLRVLIEQKKTDTAAGRHGTARSRSRAPMPVLFWLRYFVKFFAIYYLAIGSSIAIGIALWFSP